MDRVTIAASLVACASLLASVVVQHNSAVPIFHAVMLLIPLSCIAYPEIVDTAFRLSRGGRIRGSFASSPAVAIRIAGWVWLVAVIFEHHTRALGRVAA